MILKVFKSGQPYVLLLMFILPLLLWISVLSGIVTPVYTNTLYQMPLYDAFYNILNATGLGFVKPLVAYLLIYMQAFLIAKLDHRFTILRSYTYASSWVYIFLVSAIVDLQGIHPLLFAIFFLLWAAYELMKSAHQQIATDSLFKSGLAIAIGSLFYFNMYFYLFLIFIGMIFFRPFLWNEWLAVILGFLSAYLIFFELYYLLADNFVDILAIILHNMIADPIQMTLLPEYQISAIALLVIIVVASVSIWQGFGNMKITVRKYYRLFFILFILSAIFFFIFRKTGYELYIIAVIPLSYLIGRYIIFLKNKKLAHYSLYYLIAILLFIQAVKWQILEL